MARSLFLVTLAVKNPSFSPVPVNFLFLILSVCSVLSITVFLCASHRNKGFQRQEKNEGKSIMSSERKLLSKINSGLGSKAQLMVKLISWRKVQAAEEEEEDYEVGSDEAVWRKKIMMGERCRPLDFSGKILYDSQGNLLPPDSTQSDNKTNINIKVIPLGK